MQYLPSIDYFISLSPVSSRFIHSAANDKVSFICKCCKASSVCMHPISFLIYLPVNTGQFSWILCAIWQWICDCRYLLDILVLSPLDINSKEYCLDLMTNLLTIFWGTSKLFHNGYAILHSYKQATKVSLLYILANNCYFFLIIYILKCDISFDLVSISLVLSDVEHISYVCGSVFCILWKKMSIGAFYTFFKIS